MRTLHCRDIGQASVCTCHAHLMLLSERGFPSSLKGGYNTTSKQLMMGQAVARLKVLTTVCRHLSSQRLSGNVHDVFPTSSRNVTEPGAHKLYKPPLRCISQQPSYGTLGLKEPSSGRMLGDTVEVSFGQSGTGLPTLQVEARASGPIESVFAILGKTQVQGFSLSDTVRTRRTEVKHPWACGRPSGRIEWCSV